MVMTVKGFTIEPHANLSGTNLSGANLKGADLYGANLKGANLKCANLKDANLYGANLSGANLYGTNLYDAYLSGTDLYGANLSGANLKDANLKDANLSGTDLYGANLSGANLSGAKGISESDNARLQVLPDEGDIVGWKKCIGGVIVKLLIKSDTPRSSATSRKCRAKEAVVSDVIGSSIGVSMHDSKTTYKVGETVVCDTWCEDRWNECAGGIHFFITRKEAEDY